MGRTSLTVDVDVDAPPETTWRAVTAWARQGEWMLGTRVRVTGDVPDGHGLGAGLEAVTGYGPLAVTDTMTVTRWDPPRVCEVRHTGRIIRGSGVFEVAPRGPSASRLIWTEQLDLPFGVVGGLGWRVLGPAFVVGVRSSLRRFAAWAPTA